MKLYELILKHHDEIQYMEMALGLIIIVLVMYLIIGNWQKIPFYKKYRKQFTLAVFHLCMIIGILHLITMDYLSMGINFFLAFVYYKLKNF